MLSNSKRMYDLLYGLLFISLMTQYADASNYYSKQYGLPCNKCHDIIPSLKEFGQRFKINGYSFEKKVSNPKKATGSAESPATESQLSSVANTQDSANDKVKTDSAPNMPSTPPPEKIDYLYRGQSEDGTYIFTDDPLREPGRITAEKSKLNAGNTPIIQRRSTTSSKSALTGMSREKQRKKMNDSKGTVGMLKNSKPDPSVAKQSASIADTQPHGFEECMEKILIKADQPKNGADAMELFEKAEQNCAPYVTKH